MKSTIRGPRFFNVRAFVDVSTGHITLGDNERLAYCAKAQENQWSDKTAEGLAYCGLAVETKDQGLVVFDRSSNLRVDTESCDIYADGDTPCAVYGSSDEAEHRQGLLDVGFSLAFIELLSAASALGMGLWLDADGYEYAELPMFDWEQETKEGKPVREARKAK